MDRDSEYFWLELGGTVVGKRKHLPRTTFIAVFKLDPGVVDEVYARIRPYNVKAKHFLWSLHYLKTLSVGEPQIATFLSTNRKTLRLKVKDCLEKVKLAL